MGSLFDEFGDVLPSWCESIILDSVVYRVVSFNSDGMVVLDGDVGIPGCEVVFCVKFCSNHPPGYDGGVECMLTDGVKYQLFNLHSVDDGEVTVFLVKNHRGVPDAGIVGESISKLLGVLNG